MLKSYLVVLIGCGLVCGVVNSYAKTNFFADAGAVVVMQSAQHTPKIYQLYNISEQKILLDVSNKAAGAQAGYASVLDPHNASAFIYNGTQPSLIWTCQVSDAATKTSHNVNCEKVLKVSNYPSKHLKFNPNMPHHWLLENKPQDGFKPLLKSALTKA